MNEEKSSDFVRRCEKDLLDRDTETDPAKKLHLLRRLNFRMYEEACKLKYDDISTCRMIQEDLRDYAKESIPVHKGNFEKLMTQLNLDIQPVAIGPSISSSSVIELLKKKKCNGECRNQKIVEDLKKTIEYMNVKKTNENKSIPSIGFSKSAPLLHDSSKKNENENFIKNDDELVFDLKFDRIKNVADNNPMSPVNSLSPIESLKLSKQPSSEFVPKIPEHLKLPCKPSKFVSTYRTVTGGKRKAEDMYDNDENEDGINDFTSSQQNQSIERKYDFKTGTEELKDQYAKKYGIQNTENSYTKPYTGGKTLGARAGRSIRSKFVSPFSNQQQSNDHSNGFAQNQESVNTNNDGLNSSDDTRLKNIDPIMIERIQNEIMHQHATIDWDSIAGLDYAKTIIKEAVIWPMIRPELFSGLRKPPKGILLFGPPGTGKTMIGKCIASQANATFFSISASSLTSKWIGEGEKMVRALFAVATVHQPSVIFIDEIDSLLCQRSDTEHESSRRLKTEFLVQLDGATTSENDRVLIVGATNRPQELDEAARRRLVKRLYIPLPEQSAREQMLYNLLKNEKVDLSGKELKEIARLTDGYSGADMKALCSEAAMGPIRGISSTSMFTVNQNDVRPMNFNDLLAALKCVKATVSSHDLNQYVEWDKTFGSGTGK